MATRSRSVARNARRWVLSGAVALAMGAGCADVPEEGAWDEEEELEVEGHEQALTACKATVTASPSPNANWALTTINTSGVTGCTPQFLYQYSVPGSTTKVDIGTWTTNASATFTPPSVNGALKIFVQTQPVGGGVINTSQTQVLVGSSCSVATFGTSPASPQAPGTAVGLSATASCTNGSTAQYRFRVYNGSTSTNLTSWGTASSVNWNTTGLSTGNYTLYVDVRRAGNSAVDQVGSRSFTLGNTCALSSVTTDPSLSAEPSEGSVLLTANGSCSGGATGEYIFDYKLASATGWTMLQNWGTSASASWDISGLAEGDYQVRARTRATGFVDPQSGKMANFRVGGLCQAVSLGKEGVSPADSVTLLGNATCSSGTPEFKYEVSPKAAVPAAWTTLADWSTNASEVVDEADLPPGDYKFRVLLRAQGHTAVFSSNTVPFTLSEPDPSGVLNVLIAGADYSAPALRDALAATGEFASVDNACSNIPCPTPSLETLLQYDAVYVYSNNTFDDAEALGDNLADYYDAGGKVVVAVFTLGGWNFGGRFANASNGYILLDPASWYGFDGEGSLGTVVEPGSPLLEGVNSITAASIFYALGPVVNGGTVVAYWSNGAPLVIRGVVQGRKRVDLNFFPDPNNGGIGGDYIKLITNALLYQ